MAEDAKPRRVIDWEAIEREYRAGQLSVREVARLHGTNHTLINKKAKEFGWTRDLAEKVREKVRSKLVSDEVSNPVSSANVREAVEIAASRGVELVREHRRDIYAGRSLVKVLIDELREATEARAEIEAAIHDETKTDDGGKRRALMLKAVSLGTRASTISNLSVAMKNLVVLERQAFSLDDPKAEKSPQQSTVTIADDQDEASRQYRRIVSGE